MIRWIFLSLRRATLWSCRTSGLQLRNRSFKPGHNAAFLQLQKSQLPSFRPPKDSSGLCSRKCCGSHAHAKASHSITEASALGRRWANFKKNGPPQPTLRPKNSKLVCIYYETNYGQHSGTLNAGYFSIIFQAYQIN